MKTIYAVHVFGGEYEDAFDYIVAVFENQQDAMTLMDKLEEAERKREQCLKEMEGDLINFCIRKLPLREINDSYEETERKRYTEEFMRWKERTKQRYYLL